MSATTKHINQEWTPGDGERHRALVYVRTATADAPERHDAVTESQAAGQERQCREWAAAHDWTVDDVHRDVGVSGLRPSRPGLDRLLKRLDEQRSKPNSADLVVVMTDRARLARNMKLSIELQFAIEALGATIVFTEEHDHGRAPAEPGEEAAR